MIEKFLIIETPRQSGRSDKNIQLKLFSSTDEFFDEQQRMLIRELMFLRKDGGKKTKLFDGKKIERKGSSYIYSFESDSELNLPDGSPISLWQKGASESVSASVENCEDFVVIDRKIVWYGMPSSNADFISEGCKIPTKFRPVFRFAGKYFAQAVYGFLEMNRTVDSFTPTASEKQDTYDSFASYVSGEIKCDECGGIMRLKKSKKGKFYLACSNQPQCEYSRLIEIDDVESYFYFSSNTGILCPQDHTSLQARISKYGLYVSCCGIQKHFYKLDEI